MKNLILTSILALPLALAGSAAAAPEKSNPLISTTDELFGQELTGAKGEVVGTIDDLIINPKTFRVDYVVLEVGGYDRIEDSLVAIPFTALKFEDEEIVLPYERTKLVTAPSYEREKWKQMPKAKWDRLIAVYLDESEDRVFVTEQKDKSKAKQERKQTDSPAQDKESDEMAEKKTDREEVEKQSAEEGWSREVKKLVRNLSQLNAAMEEGLLTAAERSPTSEVRRLARKAAQAHRRIESRIEEVSASHIVGLPQMPSDKQEKELAQLEKVNKDTFNREFLMGAEEALGEFREYGTELGETEDPELRELGSMIERISDLQKEHLQSLRKKVENSGSTESSNRADAEVDNSTETET